MFGFKSLREMLRNIKIAIDDIKATREDVDRMKEAIKNLATTEDVDQIKQSGLATREDLDRIKEVIQNLATTEDIEQIKKSGLATKEDVDRIKEVIRNLALTEDIDQIKKSGLAAKEDVDRIKEVVHSLARDLPPKLENAINEIEFVRRRTNAFLGQGVALTYLTDQSPIFVDPRDSGVAAAVLNGGLYEPTNLDVIMSFVRPDTVFLDLGANVGIFSLQVGRRVRGAGKVYAFEPQAHLTNLVRRSAFLNGLGSLGGVGTIESHSVGVSDRDAKVGFNIPIEHLGGGRIVTEPSDDKISVVRLDGFFGEDFTCDLVKIDVEGHELQALRGMERILANSRQVKILFENMGLPQDLGSAIEDFLSGLNFKLYGVAENGILIPLTAGGLAQWDGYALAGKIGDPELEELNRRRFSIYPSQLSRQGATIEGGVLKFKGGLGKIAFHGPYWFLPRGQYRMQLHGELSGSLDVTIATRFGYPLTTCMFVGGATSSQFTIERDAVLFECVARPATEETELSLQRIEIIHL